MASLAFFFAVLGILAGSYLSPAKASTSISVVPESQSVSEREDVTVNCTASANATNLNFTWTKVGDDKVLTYSNQLTLLDINLSDAGNYSCNATNGTANWNAVAIIMVTASPAISVVPNSQTVPEGNDVTVNCTVSENATNLNFTWTKVGDNNVLTYSNQLTLLNINLSDAGNYSCYATNKVVNLHAVATIMVTSSTIISVVPKSQTALEGTDVTVNCTASVNVTYLNFTWSKGGEVKASSNLLSLPNINRLDAGSYSCNATNGTAQWQAVATINVFYPARIQSAENQTVNESSTSELFCNASGNPSPNITWSLPNGSHIYLQGKDSLKITNTTRKAHGKYNCTASNGVGDSSSDVIYLNVQYKPAIDTSGNLTVIKSWLRHHSTLDCRADGNPSPKITWSRDDGNPLNSTASGSISIIPRKEKDFGKYTCTAGNLLGKDQLSVELKRTAFPPSPPNILNTETELRNRSLILRWTSSSNNGRPILRYTVLHRVVFYHNTTKRSWIGVDAGKYLYYNLSLDWATSYHVAVTAENDQGPSNKSDIKNFTVFPEPTPKASDPPTMSGIDGTNKKLTIGLSCGVTALVLVIVIIAFVVYRRQKRRRQKRRQNTGDANSRFKSNAASTQGRNVYNVTMQDLSRSAVLNDTKEHEDEPLYSVSQPIYVNASYSEDERKNWEFPREKLHIQKKIGKGAFCVVAKAIADGLGTIAVKMPKENAPASNKKDLLAEYELLQQMKPHPNVIQLLGAVTRTDPILVMFEYIPYGDLLGFLRRSRGLDDNYFKDPDVQPSSSLKSQQLLKFAREVADGMAHLSANKIIHRDLAARNVLVGEGETCKITDFGMARDVQRDDIYQKRTRGRLPVKWTAYESLLYGFATTQSDVWSYGVVLYEIFTIGGCPYPKIEPHRIPYMIKDGYRMPQPAHLDDEIYALMCECWKTEPELRPTFQFISSTIKRLERSHKDVIYINVYNESLYDNVGDWD